MKKIILKALVLFLYVFAAEPAWAESLRKLENRCQMMRRDGDCSKLESAKCELLGYHGDGLKALFLIEPDESDSHAFAIIYGKDECEKLLVMSDCRILKSNCEKEIRSEAFNKSKKKKSRSKTPVT